MSSVPLSHKSIQKVGNRTIRVGYLRKSLGLLLKKSKKYFSIERETFSTWLLIHRKRQLLYVNSLAELKLVGDIQCEYRPEYRLWSVYRGIKEKPRDNSIQIYKNTNLVERMITEKIKGRKYGNTVYYLQ